MRVHRIAALVVWAVLSMAVRALALEPADVLVIANGAVPGSRELAEYYVSRRGIPAHHVLVLEAPTSETIDRTTFERQIEAPIAAWLRGHPALDQAVAIVLCKGLPHRIAGTAGRTGTQASLDSELTLLYRRMVGTPVAPQGPITNPYFLGSRSLIEAKRFTRDDYDTFLVTRLDGFTFADARALIDRAAGATRGGAFVLDQREGQDLADRWMIEAAARLRQTALSGGPILDISPAPPPSTNVGGVYSWGSSDPALRTRRAPYAFEPGAIGGRFLSSDARTFREPPDDWLPTGWEGKEGYFEGSPESLVGDLVRDGLTAVSGNVAEPYLDSAVRPDILLPAYASGFSVAEAFYLAMPSLGWQTVVLGDPLTSPYGSSPRTEGTGGARPPSLDSVTGYPTRFSDRRVDLMRAVHVVSRESAKLMVRAERLLLANDNVGAMAALEQAVAQDADFGLAHTMLASLYETLGRHDAAQERYRVLLRLRPRDTVALNNLAFSLAERSNRAAEALPLAEQAYLSGRNNPLVADTLGWVHFKLGDYPKAAAFLQEAVGGAPGRADIRVRLALALAAQERWTEAENELGRARQVDPDVDRSEAAKRLADQIRKAGAAGRP